MGIRPVFSPISSAPLIVAGLSARAVPQVSSQSIPTVCVANISNGTEANMITAIQTHLSDVSFDAVSISSGSVALTSTLTISRALTVKSADRIFFSKGSGQNLSNPIADHLISITSTGSGVVVLEKLESVTIG